MSLCVLRLIEGQAPALLVTISPLASRHLHPR